MTGYKVVPTRRPMHKPPRWAENGYEQSFQDERGSSLAKIIHIYPEEVSNDMENLVNAYVQGMYPRAIPKSSSTVMKASCGKHMRMSSMRK
jgi:hypothetical protein